MFSAILKNKNSKNFYVFYFTLIVFMLYFIFYVNKSDQVVDPSLYMNDKLTKSQQLKVKIHASHHSKEEIDELVKKLEKGESWHDAHAVLKTTPLINHLSHIDTEIISIFIQCLTITTGLLFAYTIQSFYDIYTPIGSPLLKIWYNFLCFAFTLLTFAIMTMTAKHYLSFRTFNESTLFI